MRQKLSDYQQSMYNFFSPTATFIAVCVIVYALLEKKIISMPNIGLVDITIIALASFRLIRFFCFDSMFQFMRDKISYNIKVVEENGDKYVEKTPVGVGYRRLLTNLLDCVWCVGIWTTLVTFLLYVSSGATAILVVVFAIAGVATFFQLVAALIGTKYEECDMRNEEMRKR